MSGNQKRMDLIVDIIRAEKNLGGSGGFYLGQKRPWKQVQIG